MHQTQRFLLSVFASIAAFAAGLNTAAAQEVSAPGGFEFLVYPYLWMPAIHATTLTSLEHEPQVNSDVSFIQILGHLDGAPFMGSFEIRNGDLGFLVDYIHLPVSTTINTHDIFYRGGNAELHANIATGDVLWRVLKDPVQFADIGAAFRVWGWESDLGLGPGLLPGVSVSRSGGWTDPLIAGRYHRDLGNGFGLTAYGDFGGHGGGAHTDWQVLGTVDYTLNPSLNLYLGYRSLNFDITASDGRFGFTAHLRGPILGGTFRF